MKFLGYLPHFYTRKYNDNGVLRNRKGTDGHQCNRWHKFLLSSSFKPLRMIFLKPYSLFQKMVGIQYNPTLVDSDQSDIRSFIKSTCRSLYRSEMKLLHKRKYRLDIHIEMKGRLPKEKLSPSGSPIIQVPGAVTSLNDFVDLYTNNPASK